MRITFNWGTGIALVYTAFAAATTGFVAFAMSRPVDLVSADYYEQSLRLDSRMEAERNASALNPGPVIDLPAPRRLAIVLPGQPASGVSGTVTLYRPSDARADRVQKLAIDTAGRQEIALDTVAPGRWIVQLQWTAGGRGYYFESPIVVR
jgi:hypothetical protein